jgi:adenine-specific DNA-methyltransferase
VSIPSQLVHVKRYSSVTEKKAGGETYTPKLLADFVAREILQIAKVENLQGPLRVLDPAVGDGQLLISLLDQLDWRDGLKVEVYGFDTNAQALADASARLKKHFPSVSVRFKEQSFLTYVLDHLRQNGSGSLFRGLSPDAFDLIIANPPYVRTQIMGASQAQYLAEQFGLFGRVDLYYAFLIGMAELLKPCGMAGIIVSNRFMTTKSGASVRAAIRDRFSLRHIWDLGDTKLFDAAVLPAVLLVGGRDGNSVQPPGFTSIYATAESAEVVALDAIEALRREGVVEVTDGRQFRVRHGKLDATGAQDDIWRIATEATDAWLATVQANTWGTFGDIGKIRVGVKTCADKIFIKSDWHDMPANERPELLRPLTTHHIARRYKPAESTKVYHVLYTHEVVNGQRRVVDLKHYPRARSYLERHRAALESRKYVLDAGRQWFELWVPQDPAAWDASKLVFRDISEEPTFWIDKKGTVVNGDCYWLIAEKQEADDLLWLAVAVGNSKFIESFYDHRFHNKLYAGRRRFITQYVEQFPLPDPTSPIGRTIIAKAKAAYEFAGTDEGEHMADVLDQLVWKAFGLPTTYQRNLPVEVSEVSC